MMDTYEKKYNEALRLAKQYYGEGCNEFLDTLFPELRESEDERITRNLVEAFTEYKKSGGTDFHGIEVNSLLAWLDKKQPLSYGEGMYYQHKDGALTFISSPATFMDSSDLLEKQKEQKPAVPVLPCSAAWFEDDDEKQKEPEKIHKPVEFKNDELVEIIRGEFEGFRSLLKKKGIDYEPQRSYWEGFARLFDSSAREYVKGQKKDSPLEDYSRGYNAGYYHGITDSEQKPVKNDKNPRWYERIQGREDVVNDPERFGLQKPTEWSEENEKLLDKVEAMLDSYCDYLEDASNDYIPEVRETISQLKSLRPQPQGTYKQIVHSIYNMLKDKDFFEIQPSHRVSLLNDIRVKCKIADECAEILDEPHWKPSDEQMDALLNSLHPDDPYYVLLQSLHDDLLKLK